jgi:hypothetical protein
MVGFSLMHIHPTFAVIGVLSCIALMLWMLPAIYFLIARWKIVGFADVAMVILAVLVVAAVIVPDNFFA